MYLNTYLLIDRKIHLAETQYWLWFLMCFGLQTCCTIALGMKSCSKWPSHIEQLYLLGNLAAGLYIKVD